MEEISQDEEEDEDEDEADESEEEEEEEEDLHLEGAAKDCLLGSKEDKRALVGILTRFRRDDLASTDDEVVAAVRMQVHRTSSVQHSVRTFLTCTMWSFFEPREDQGYCLLTRKGRVIYYGKGQEAQPDLVMKYLQRVLCNVSVVFLIICVLISCLSSSSKEVAARHWILITVGLGVTLVLVAVYTYAQRPRSDCGATYRQHFSVENLSAGTYARADTGRHLRQCCVRRRTGHLRLCFGRRFPDAETLGTGLPSGAPDVGGVTVVQGFPGAMAAERAMAHKDQLEDESGRHLGVGPRCQSFVTLLAAIGLVYDYVAFASQVVIDESVCSGKVAGCHWRVENPTWLGKKKLIEGTFPPTKLSPGRGCDSHEEFCDYFYQPTDYCLPPEQLGPPKLLKVKCSEIWRIREIMGSESDRGHRMYVTREPRKFNSLPTAENPNHHVVTIEAGMRLVAVGSRSSPWTASLQRQQRMDFSGIVQRCKDEYQGAMSFLFKKEPLRTPLFEEDCQEIQEACNARVFGPKTYAFWPPNHWFDPRFQHSLCWYEPRTLEHKVWHELEKGGPDVPGLTCQGQPLSNLTLTGRNTSLMTCKSMCEQRADCRYAFISIAAKRKGRLCLLYSECPRIEQPPSQLKFEKVKCGKPCQDDNVTKCDATYQPFRTLDRNGDLGMSGCRRKCLQIIRENHFVSCNAFAYSYDAFLNSSVCIIYGPSNMPKPMFMEALNPAYPPGTVGRADHSGCFIRSFPAPSNRKLAGTPGTLLEYTDKRSCSGCYTHSVMKFLLTPSNLASLMQSFLNIVGLLVIARVVHHSVQVGRVVFSGRPIVNMYIVDDVANRENFAARERGYATFLSRCFEVASASSDFQVPPAPDVWHETAPRQQLTEDAEIVPVSMKSFDRWELSNALRTRCFVDKDLLGIAPNETVRAAWSDSNWMGLGRPALFSLFWLGFNVFFAIMLPKDSGVLVAKEQLVVFLAVLLFGWLYYYIELRRELQGLVVVTTGGRLVQVSRRPPPVFLASWRGGTSVRLDSFYLGRVYVAQMDMPATPFWEDRIRAGVLRKPWRRGSVTAQCSKGLLCVKRFNGEVLAVFKGLEELAYIRKTEGLHFVGTGCAELCGLCPARDLFRVDERHVWERKLEAYGFFGDPFNYASLLTITDTRVLVTRVRIPKDLTLRALLLGPLSCGRWCRTLQEHIGTNAFLSVSSVWNDSLESYATTRTRAPPFWPGFLSPVNSISFAFLGAFMLFYPAGLFVTKRPYGIPTQVRVKQEVSLAAKAGVLRISHSFQPGAPRGHVVVRILGPDGREVALDDPRWAAKEGGRVEEGTQLTLEAADPEWKKYADEPWLWQLRSILDHILGHSVAPADVWEDLSDEEPPPPPPRRCCGRLMALVFGGDMLGQKARLEEVEEDSDDETNEKEPLVAP